MYDEIGIMGDYIFQSDNKAAITQNYLFKHWEISDLFFLSRQYILQKF